MKLVEAIIIGLVVAGVLAGISTIIQNTDISTIPAEWQPLWNGLYYAVATGSGAAVFTFLRNILGYVYTRFESEGGLPYDKKKLFATWARFEFYMLTLSEAVMIFTANTPYSQYAIVIAGTISTLLDLGLRSLTNVASAIKTANT
jgi:hypothetical protein